MNKIYYCRFQAPVPRSFEKTLAKNNKGGGYMYGGKYYSTEM